MIDRLADLKRELRGPPSDTSPEQWFALAAVAGELRDAARIANADEAANQAWHLGMVASARGTMCELYENMCGGNFREAWIKLEKVEKIAEAIQRNSILDDDFGINDLGEMVARWQSLYPYTVFASPEIIIKQQHCTICHASVSPLRPCGHLPGRVYAGEMCARKITEAKAVSIALVRDPVQKYSVLIPRDDPHDYARLKFLLQRVSGPFARWSIHHTTALHDHALFSEWPRDGNCPCHSGERYADCCALRTGVRLPHDQIYFEDPIPSDLPRLLLRRRMRPDGTLEDVEIKPRAA